ncbi:MAG: HEAT repeat domain-containing protein [Chloroflexota bacterium]|nr:HEAT repeat domain-containing protein [Chloroflexota bacterium]
MTDDDDPWQEKDPRRLACELRLDLSGSSAAVQSHESAFLELIDRLLEVAKQHRPIRIRDADETDGSDAVTDTGDGLVAFFDDLRMAAECAFALRSECGSLRWERAGLPRLLPRIALHVASYAQRAHARLKGAATIESARLEPVVTPGEIWVTETFAAVFRSLSSTYVDLSYLGKRRWAKEYGEAPVYRLTSAPAERAANESAMSAETLALELAAYGSDEQRLGALDALGASSGHESRRLLEKIARDKGEPFELRRMALLSLEEQNSPDSTPALTELLRSAKDHAPAVAELAIQVLGAVGDQRAVAALVRLVTPLIVNAQGDLNSVAVELGRRALLALRHFRASIAGDKALNVLEARTEPDLVVAACVAAAAQNPNVNLMAKLLAVAADAGIAAQVRSVALEALISLQRRPVIELGGLAGDATQEKGVAGLLVQDTPMELRQLAVIYLAGCATTSALSRLLDVAHTPEDPLRMLALSATARSELPATSLPPGTGIGTGGGARAMFERLDSVVRSSTDHKLRLTTDPAAAGSNASARSWPPPRRRRGR